MRIWNVRFLSTSRLGPKKRSFFFGFRHCVFEQATRSNEGDEDREDGQGRCGFTQIDATDGSSDSDAPATSTKRSADQPAIITQSEIQNHCDTLADRKNVV